VDFTGITTPDGHRQRVAFMTLTGSSGLFCFDRTVEWVRSVTAASISHSAGKPDTKLGAYGMRESASGIALAVGAAADTARAFRPFETLSFSVEATAWDVPYLVDEVGALSEIPAAWMIMDEDLMSEWMSDLNQGRTPDTADTARLCPIERGSATVWASNRSDTENQAALDAFADELSIPKAETVDELQAPPMMAWR
jgi:hypothetical protein